MKKITYNIDCRCPNCDAYIKKGYSDFFEDGDVLAVYCDYCDCLILNFSVDFQE